MLTFLIWYLLITLIGWVSFPLIFRLMPALADRGYSFSRILGLLVWSYVYWLLASLGIIKNDIGGLLVGLFILISLSAWAIRSSSIDTLRTWLKENWVAVISVELLFLVAFTGWALVRAANPEILGTEKPMELAFINSILHSPEFPPRDPWLSGYAISYYYFGYVMTAMLAKLTATPGSMAFNLALSQTFALVAIAAYGILYSLLSVYRKPLSNQVSPKKNQNLLLSLLGPTFILLVSNLEGFLEVLHARGILWKQEGGGQLSSAFWTWLDLKELSQPPSLPFSWIPSRYLWWWRASRVIQDYDLSGTWREIIDEFPFFSFLLGDLHPHVLVLPFALLAVGLSLNIFLGGGKGKARWLWINLNINSITFWFAAIVIGGLAFLNTWDFPMYVVLFSLVYVWWRFGFDQSESSAWANTSERKLVEEENDRKRSVIWKFIKQFLGIAFPLSVSGVILYLPFYFGFSSQAGGILPNMIFSTRGTHLWIMFGSLLLPIFVYLVFIRSGDRGMINFGKGFLISLGLVLILWLVSLGLGMGIASIPFLGDIFISSLGGGVRSSLLAQSLSRRFAGLGWVTLLILFTFVFGYFISMIDKNKRSKISGKTQASLEETGSNRSISINDSVHDFVFILILMGGLLVLFVEFFYLRDQFGSRMNTIFKFFYQTWIFWGLAAAFGTAVLLKRLQGIWNILFRIGFGLLLLAALTYPLLSLWNKTSGFKPSAGYTLDGTAYLDRNVPDDMAAIRWLENAGEGVVVEAIGPQYSEYARVATNSGQSNVLGWVGHESQWRGGREEIGTREEDIAAIYSTNDWQQTKLLLDMYGVRYLVIGDLERRTYRVNEAKFQRFLGQPVFQSGQTLVYEIPREQ
jgi:YYY domain-containing protein